MALKPDMNAIDCMHLAVVTADGLYNNSRSFALRQDPRDILPAPKGRSQALSGGKIAGVSIGTIIAVLLILLGLWWLVQRKNKRRIHADTRDPIADKPELSGESFLFWKKLVSIRSKRRSPVELPVRDEQALRSELPGTIPEPAELPEKNTEDLVRVASAGGAHNH